MERPVPEPERHPFLTALRVSAWGIVLLTVVAATAVLLFIHRGDAVGSGRIANREVEFLLQPGERIERRAPVMQRHWWDYFRVTHGVLAATDRRLIFVGVPPADILPRDEEPLALAQGSYPYDRPLEVRRTRVFLGTQGGIVIRTQDGDAAFGVSTRLRPRLDSVLVTTGQKQQALRDAEERARQTELAAALAARQPIFHVVERGEALDLIAQRYGTTTEMLRTWNGLPNDVIKVGQRLLVKPRT